MVLNEQKTTPQANFMADTDLKKMAGDRGLYVLDPDRIGAGPPQEGKYTESKKSYFVRKYMEIHSVRYKTVAAPVEREPDV